MSGGEPILIWGAGAIGGTLGAALVRTGQNVIFVDNAADHVRAINANGLRIDGPIWTDTVSAKAAVPEDLKGQFGRVFLCVKAQHTKGAIAQLAPHLTDDGYVVSAQNGLNEMEIAQVVGRERTVGCFVNFGADYLEPGVVHFSGRGAVVVGELDGEQSARIKGIHALMLALEPNAVITDNIFGYLWGKMIYGALLFATALTNDSIADVLDDGAARPVLTRLARETGAVASAAGFVTIGFDGFDPLAFGPDSSEDLLNRSFEDMVAHNRRSAKSHSGIWRDLAVRKRKTEAEAQLGPIVTTGQRVGVPTPLTARVVEMIQEIERGERPLSRENLDELETTAEVVL